MLPIVNKTTTRNSCRDSAYSHGNKTTIMMVRRAAAPALQIRANFHNLWASPSSNFTSTFFLFYKYLLFKNVFNQGRIISFPPFPLSGPSQIPSQVTCHTDNLFSLVIIIVHWALLGPQNSVLQWSWSLCNCRKATLYVVHFHTLFAVRIMHQHLGRLIYCMVMTFEGCVTLTSRESICIPTACSTRDGPLATLQASVEFITLFNQWCWSQ